MAAPRENSCPICGEPRVARALATARLVVFRCGACGHRVALHAEANAGPDYHEQYERGSFLDALRATRERQATAILHQIGALDQRAKRLLDLGCGRGWFLDAARASGFDVVGADTSPLAIRLIRDRGIPGVLLEPDAAPADGLPFRPTVVTLLDVIEHFAPDRVIPALAHLREVLRPDLSLMVVKVPVSEGVLYRTASALAGVGSPGLLEQLYQAGTDPPHRSYFSKRSIRMALDRSGFEVVAEFRDRDFEPARLGDRALALRRLPRAVVDGIGHGIAAAATLFAAQDSIVLFASPR